ncbi:hypothetical protein [Spirosoma pollinicola]|uniref:Uncharacterized protein n=1 Tax=Spirosoma pollinicola TaxID=2057025 RepID=A0A2K8ZAD9_9BACT|nr:hypothetical protein [Spirosoma pollinicola]AUD06842.1 hypothetical protein CWM47_36325 [Spirosoma pollinicola]
MVDFEFQPLQEIVGVDSDTMYIVLEDFRELGLISQLNPMRAGTQIRLQSKAHTFFLRGGFAVEDALNEANIKRILYDLESLQKQLKPDQLDAFNKIASIASSIATVLTTFSDKN